MSDMRALVNFAVLNANRRAGKNYLDGLVPFLEELFIRKQYELVNIEQICNDFNTEFLFRIPAHPMKVVLKRLVKVGKLSYLHQNVWKKVAIEDKNILKTRNEYEMKYKSVLVKFLSFVKKEYSEDITEKDANDALIAFLEKQDASLLLFAKNNIRLLPQVTFEKKMLRQLAYFLRAESENSTDTFEYITEIASGHMLASTIVNEEKELHEEKVEKVKIYCDTAHILKLLGLAGEIPRKMTEDLFHVFVDAKCCIYLFRHTYDEILHNISNAKKWYNSSNCDMSKASRTTLFFIENNYTNIDIDRIQNSIDEKLKKYSIDIEESSYESGAHLGQINEQKLREYIVNEYRTGNEDFDEISNKYLIDNDVKSIAMIYRKMTKRFPGRFKDLNIVFLCANASLARACKKYHLTNEETKRESFIPFCVTDIFLGTYMWLQSPHEIDQLAKGKIIAEVYAVLKPSDALIRKYLTEVQLSLKHDRISQDDYLLLRASSVINELLPDSIESEELVTDKTPTDMLDRIKNLSKEEGLRKYYAEKDEHNKTRERLEELMHAQEVKNRTKEDKKNRLVNKFKFTIDVILAIILFGLGYLLPDLLALNNVFVRIIAKISISIIPVLSFWGIARKNSYYEDFKSRTLAPIISYICKKLWADL